MNIQKDWTSKPKKPNTSVGEYIVMFIFLFIILPGFLWLMQIMEVAQ